MNKILIGIILVLCILAGAEGYPLQKPSAISYPYQQLPQVMAGTKLLVSEGDLSIKILDGAHRFIDEKIKQSGEHRSKLWTRDTSSKEAYEKSVEPNRKRFMQYIGVQNKNESINNNNAGNIEKHPAVLMEKYSLNNDPELVAETSKYRIYQVRWPVLNRVNGEGLLLQPKTKITANIIAIPDADQTPEQLAGLSSGISKESQFARHLAENGFQVLIPVLVDRTFMFPQEELIAKTAFEQFKNFK